MLLLKNWRNLMPSYETTICLSPSCKDRRECARHWSHHGEAHNPYSAYATYDGSQGKDGCDHFKEREKRDPIIWLRRDGIH